MHLDPVQALLMGAAAVAIVGGILGIILQLRKIRGQNDEQLAKQTRFELDWKGDPDAHPRVPGMVERVANIESNTAPIPGQIEELRGRVGKLEEERLLDRQQLERHLQDHP